jgi:hypothetical protein
MHMVWSQESKFKCGDNRTLSSATVIDSTMTGIKFCSSNKMNLSNFVILDSIAQHFDSLAVAFPPLMSHLSQMGKTISITRDQVGERFESPYGVSSAIPCRNDETFSPKVI